ncbi:class I adenylate-forming enzyme family protein [Cesiribacter andamanensis]|uniref:Long-chain-fatty-acid--CoA ligase n=1 Tax=Cesiribacter andamanensis AMV16 TaxID=1279009 RepID=M7N495_9BACT|nr:long-chain fatty acid--CoA ligase [Cesiribacter andamanensis]EMR02112.1 Long-chain-fatty-acid--CoA ligase [Cesiribacter andamanensis AMV16]
MPYRKDWIERWALYQPEKQAVREHSSQRSLSYGQLQEQGLKAAAFLKEKLKLQKGSRVAILADFCLEHILLFAAAQKLGIILVPLNYRLTGRELAFMLDNCRPELFLADERYYPLLEGQHILEQIRHLMSPAAFSTAIAEHPCQGFDSEELEDDHPLFILYTSGTTGFPKGALYTHGMAFWNSINTATRLDITSQDHTLVCMPPFHTGGWNVFLTPFLHHGASVTLLPKFEAGQVLQLLEQEKATLFMAVPTMLKMLLDVPEFAQVGLESIRYFIVGGEPLPIPTIERWHQKGVLIRQGYGLTEVGPNVTSLNHQDAVRKQGSIGTPNFYVEYQIMDDAGKPVAQGEAGEFWLRGPMVTPGYWQNPEGTAAAKEGDWFKTGDMVRQDAEGFLYVVDRKKNMFISGGENVYPAEVEHYLIGHPAIEEVAIVGTPDERWGEVGKAFVALKEGAMLSEQEILEFCRQGLAKYKIPKYVQFVGELPKTDTGKIARMLLK